MDRSCLLVRRRAPVAWFDAEGSNGLGETGDHAAAADDAGAAAADDDEDSPCLRPWDDDEELGC
jgi:hypothetical protein